MVASVRREFGSATMPHGDNIMIPAYCARTSTSRDTHPQVLVGVTGYCNCARDGVLWWARTWLRTGQPYRAPTSAP